MATAAGSTSQEYWRPSNPDVARVVTSIRGTCRRCGTDYSPGARYCNACGMSRDPRRAEMFLDSEAIQEQGKDELARHLFGLSLPCAAFFILGMVCTVAALAVGVLYREDTLVDWQAVQAWRVEWLLAAIASLLAGVLLKTKNGSN